VVFTCQLGDQCARTVDITNPSPRTASYWIKLIGSQDFVPSESEMLVVEGRGTASLEIVFHSRLSATALAQLMLIPRRGGMHNPNPLIYELKSQIVGRKSIRKPEVVRSVLY
jgi:hypothetical protein